MNSEKSEFLSWKMAPARLDAQQAAWFLGFRLHEIPILVARGLLRPLGHPARNSAKFFAAEVLGELRRDEKWLARASDAIGGYWREKNARKTVACGRANRGPRATERSGREVQLTADHGEAVAVGAE